ncbi:hypothetical protein [Nocardioides bruguierae]|uniref:Uncharacterized protein n=1 Tax=Nocardioides bruguierae TaxID=2945102 RepID=A0A9X2DBF3_9ACTN|nr:hypothetical protein [Nocardioides bruguierae]MCM0622519.1 hypothetical protein [Nocardioides bruguierae]
MTLVFTVPGAVTSPIEGSLTLPSIGATGLISRYHATNTQALDIGDTVTTLADWEDTGYDLAASGGPVTVQEDSAGRYLDFSAGGTENILTSGALSAQPDQMSLAALVYLAATPASGVQFFQARVGRLTLSALSDGKIGAYDGGSAFPRSAVATKPGWFRVIGTFDRTGTTGAVSITVNGATTVGDASPSTQDWTFGLRSNLTLGLRLRDAAVFDHILDSEEIAAVDAALAAQL